MTTGEQLNLVLVYIPPSSPQTNTAALCNLLRNLDNNSILIGDINMPGIDWTAGRADTKGRELLVGDGRGATAKGKLSHSYKRQYIGLITNCPERVVDVQDMSRLGKSDHCMLCVAIKCRPFTCKDNQVGLNWNRANIPAMRQDLDRHTGEKNLK